MRATRAGLADLIRRDHVVPHTDHVVPHADGGPTSADNGQGLCAASTTPGQPPS